MIGLGTNTPIRLPVWLLVKEYNYARSINVGDFWFNANNWQAKSSCNASQGSYGCPQVGIQFFERIGVSTPVP